MKIPLRFQITEFDCGTVALQNAISYLYEREDIPAELIREITLYTINCYDDEGRLKNNSLEIARMTDWITNYTNDHDFKLEASHYIKEDVNLEMIKNCISSRGCVFLRTYLEKGHFVTITDIDSEYVYLWDPYYLDEDYYDLNSEIIIILDQPFKYNRMVKLSKFMASEETNYALGPVETRECVCFERK